MQTVKTMAEHICKSPAEMKINLFTYCGDKESLALDTNCENNYVRS